MKREEGRRARRKERKEERKGGVCGQRGEIERGRGREEEKKDNLFPLLV